MGTRSLNDLGAEGLREGINHCIHNAESLLKSGAVVRDAGYLGIANSLFILSCEESIKAFALFHKFLVDDQRDVTPMFRDHKEKHEVAKQGYHLMSSEVKAMDRSFKEAISALPNASREELETEASKRYPAILKTIEKDQSSVESDMAWWDMQNHQKNQGLYVGWANGWTTPSQTTEKIVRETTEKAIMLLGHIAQYRDVELTSFRSVRRK